MTLKAFHNDPALKKLMVQSSIEHREADAFIRGDYADIKDGQFRGCSLGCALQTALGNQEADFAGHEAFPDALGLPEWLAHLQEFCFENMGGDHTRWNEQLMAAIPVGADLSRAKHRILARIQREVVANPTEVNETVAKLHDRQAGGEDVPDYEWSAAESAAESARSAWSARSAAWSADSAGSAAVSAARSAAGSAAVSAARSAAGSAAVDQVAAIILEEVAREAQ